MWFLRSRRLGDDMAATIAHFAPRVEALAARLPAAARRRRARARVDAAVARYVGAGRAPTTSRRASSRSTRCMRRSTSSKSRRRRSGRSSSSPRSTSSLRRGSACRGCARGSPRCRRPALADAGAGARCRTICPACSARSPPKCWAAAAMPRRRARADRRLAGAQPARRSSARGSCWPSCARRRAPDARCCRSRCASCATWASG